MSWTGWEGLHWKKTFAVWCHFNEQVTSRKCQTNRSLLTYRADRSSQPSRVNLSSLFETGKASHTVHTTPLCREEDVQSPVTPSPCQTASQHEGADKGATTQQGWGGGQADNIYSNVDFSAEPRVPPDNLCYSTVSFTRVPPESPVASIANAYSTITYLPSDESSVYSNIWTSACVLAWSMCRIYSFTQYVPSI